MSLHRGVYAGPGRRAIRVLALLGMVAGAAAALAGCERAPDVIKVGVAQPLSGNIAALGQDMLNGARMAVDEINAAGGVDIRGKKVPLAIVAVDDKSTNEAGDAAAHKLADEGVEVAIADLNSGVSIHAAPIYAGANIPQLAISTKPEFTRLGFPTTLRLVASDDLQSKALGWYAGQLPDQQRYAVVDDGTPYGKGLADAAAKVMAGMGRKIAVRRSYDEKITDFAPLLAEFKASRTDLLVTTLGDFQVEALMQQMAKAGLAGMTIIGADTIKTDRLLRNPVPIKALYATSSIIDPKEFPGGKLFLEKFHQLHQADPVYGAHYAYDAVYLVADALSRNASVDRDALLRTLKQFDGNCPMTNSMRFGPDGEQRYGAVSVYQLRGGVWEPLMRSDRW